MARCTGSPTTGSRTAACTTSHPTAARTPWPSSAWISTRRSSSTGSVASSLSCGPSLPLANPLVSSQTWPRCPAEPPGGASEASLPGFFIPDKVGIRTAGRVRPLLARKVWKETRKAARHATGRRKTCRSLIGCSSHRLGLGGQNLLFSRQDADVAAAAPLILKAHDAGDAGKQRVVLAAADV